MVQILKFQTREAYEESKLERELLKEQAAFAAALAQHEREEDIHIEHIAEDILNTFEVSQVKKLIHKLEEGLAFIIEITEGE